MIQKSNVRAGKCWKYPSQLPEIILLIHPAEWDIFSRTPIIIDYGRLLGTLLHLDRFSADKISGNSTESQQVYFLQCIRALGSTTLSSLVPSLKPAEHVWSSVMVMHCQRAWRSQLDLLEGGAPSRKSASGG